MLLNPDDNDIPDEERDSPRPPHLERHPHPHRPEEEEVLNIDSPLGIPPPEDDADDELEDETEQETEDPPSEP